MKPYVVTIADRAGVFGKEFYRTFADALTARDEAAAKYKNKCVLVHNASECDLDTDGLTDEEREQL